MESECCEAAQGPRSPKRLSCAYKCIDDEIMNKDEFPRIVERLIGSTTDEVALEILDYGQCYTFFSKRNILLVTKERIVPICLNSV